MDREAIGKDKKAILGSALPETARLLKASDFSRVFRKPMVSSDSCFKVLARPNGMHRSRLGMAVSRQVDKRAVVRNRIKRVIRESFRVWAANGPGVDVVVLPRKETATICNKRLFSSLEMHWSRIETRVNKEQSSEPVDR